MNSFNEKLRFGLQRIFIEFQAKEKLLTEFAIRLHQLISKNIFQVKIFQEKIINLYGQKLQNTKQNIFLLQEKISYLNPKTILERGYSIAYDETGSVIKSSNTIQKGERITLVVRDGKIYSTVETVE